MLMTPPPTGYSPFPINRQTIQPQGIPGVQGKPVTGRGTTGLGMNMPALSGNQMGGMNNQALINALGK
jgi:hypothetical protein